jgi:hypothetical protein
MKKEISSHGMSRFQGLDTPLIGKIPAPTQITFVNQTQSTVAANLSKPTNAHIANGAYSLPNKRQFDDKDEEAVLGLMSLGPNKRRGE